MRKEKDNEDEDEDENEDEDEDAKGEEEEISEEFDTVLLAIGRTGEADKLGLENAGVWFKKGKLPVQCEQTNVPNIFCIGDLIQDRPELTPVAKTAGKKVVARLFKGEDAYMDYNKIAGCVFTPLEYGMIGYTEEQCKEKFGEDGFVKFGLGDRGRGVRWLHKRYGL